jgi:putative ABC transport system permease protein
VLKNFTYASMANEIQPLTLAILADTDSFFSKRGSTLFAKINAHTNLPTLLATMQGIYKKYDADTPFSYTFADDAFNEQYKAEDRLASIFSVFTYLTMMLATLGLFGLAAFSIEQRAKEIGIRKVLGASLAAITTLLSKDFLKLVVLAIIIASPVAWWAMHNWLQNFAYRITIGWWVFALAGGIAVIIALITVSFQSVKAAIANPVKSLKSE